MARNLLCSNRNSGICLGRRYAFRMQSILKDFQQGHEQGTNYWAKHQAEQTKQVDSAKYTKEKQQWVHCRLPGDQERTHYVVCLADNK